MTTLLWLYFAAMTVLMVAGAVGKLILKTMGKYEAVPKTMQWEEAITVPFLAVSLLGMYGYLAQVGILNSTFWKLYFVLVVLQIFVSFFLPKQRQMKKKFTQRNYILLNVVGVIASLPMYFILFSYAFVEFPS